MPPGSPEPSSPNPPRATGSMTFARRSNENPEAGKALFRKNLLSTFGHKLISGFYLF
jgi:hypothetical protein